MPQRSAVRGPAPGSETQRDTAVVSSNRPGAGPRVGCPPPLVAEIAGDQLRRGLAVARMECQRAEAEGPAN